MRSTAKRRGSALPTDKTHGEASEPSATPRHRRRGFRGARVLLTFLVAFTLPLFAYTVLPAWTGALLGEKHHGPPTPLAGEPAADGGDVHPAAGLTVAPDVTPWTMPSGATAVVPVSLIMPVYQPGSAEVTAQRLVLDLLAPLVDREEALCFRRGPARASDDEPYWSLHVVIVTNAPPGGPLAEVMASARAAKAALVHQGGSQVWTLRWEDAQSLVRATRGGGGGAHGTTSTEGSLPSSCYADTVTVVAIETPANARLDEADRPLVYLESYVQAGLRTPGGSAGAYFLVLPSHLVPTRAPHTTFEDETRQPPFGFTEALLRTARRRNNGRIAAVQCGVLTRDSLSVSTSKAGDAADPRSLVPVPLTVGMLPSFEVVDRGGFVTAAAHKHVLPLLARRYAGMHGGDQRIFFEEPISAVSFHCGLFHKGLYDAVGGLEAALTGYPTRARPGSGRDDMGGRTIHYAGDSAAWKLSFAMQERRPSWQVYASRAVGVWVKGAPLTPLELGLGIGLYALTDGYGQRHYALLQLLQARRFGLGWRDRIAPLTDDAGGGASALVGLERAGLPPGRMLPPILTYYMDFPCRCCGLAFEAAGYLRPLIERYSLSTHVKGDYCPKRGAQLLSMAFQTHRQAVFGQLTPQEKSFWRTKALERVQVNFLHVRAHRYSAYLRRSQKREYTMNIGRSLTEFSNLDPSWVKGCNELTDGRLWVTADFFKTVYRRHGIDEAKIRTLPEAVDAYALDPANVKPLPMPMRFTENVLDSMPWLTAEERAKRYVFLSIFKWEPRKGWDILLSAYYDAFGPNAPPEMRNRTTLILKVKFTRAYSRGLSLRMLEGYLRDWAHRTGSIPNFTGLDTLPHLIVLEGTVTSEALIRLYATANAFVFPSRGEGWGLPAAEAMAMGLPLIITPWSGLLGFTTPETSFRIPLDGLEELPHDSRSAYRFVGGQKWAIPSRNGTAELMRYVVANPERAREVGRRGRRLMLDRFSEEAVADAMDADIAEYLRQEVKRRQG